MVFRPCHPPRWRFWFTNGQEKKSKAWLRKLELIVKNSFDQLYANIENRSVATVATFS